MIWRGGLFKICKRNLSKTPLQALRQKKIKEAVDIVSNALNDELTRTGIDQNSAKSWLFDRYALSEALNRQNTSDCGLNWHHLIRDLESGLETWKSSELIHLCGQTGIRLKRQRKSDAIRLLSDNMLESLRFLVFGENSLVVSIDIGINNMACIYLEVPGMRIVSGDIESISNLKDVPRNWVGAFSEAMYRFSRQVMKNTNRNQPVRFLIEQQMLSYNIRCSILESQLHAFFYPNARSISTQAVSSFFKLSEDRTKYGFSSSKKKFSEFIITEWITKNSEGVDGNGIPIKFSEKISEKFFQTPKKDDLSDAILNSIMYVIHLKRLSHSTLKILDTLKRN